MVPEQSAEVYRISAQDVLDAQYPSKIVSLLQDAAVAALETFPERWLQDDPSFLHRLLAEADRLRVWKLDYLMDDVTFDTFLRKSPELIKGLLISFCSLLDGIVRSKYNYSAGFLFKENFF